MTREQQITNRELEASMEKYLISFGWERDGRCWRHRKIKNLGVECAFTTLDAMLQTRADPTLGWPERR